VPKPSAEPSPVLGVELTGVSSADPSASPSWSDTLVLQPKSQPSSSLSSDPSAELPVPSLVLHCSWTERLSAIPKR
jgi:hypothetical protein